MTESGEIGPLPEYPFDLDMDARLVGLKAALDHLTSEGLRVTAIQMDEAIFRFFGAYTEHFGSDERG